MGKDNKSLERTLKRSRFAKNRDIDFEKNSSPEQKVVLWCTEIGIVLIFLLYTEEEAGGFLSHTTPSLGLQARIVLESTLNTYCLCGNKPHDAYAPFLAKNSQM